jgi:hypothetical protein
MVIEMAVHFHFTAINPNRMPERVEVTQDLERRFKLQEEAKAAERAAKLQQAQTSPEPATAQP